MLVASGIVHFCSKLGLASPKLSVSPTETAAIHIRATVSAPAMALSDEELLRTATNGASAEYLLNLERQWLAEDPLDDKTRVSRLLLTLCDAGKFRNALALANAAPVALQTNWLQLTFTRWAQRQPHDAVKALEDVANSALRSTAFRAAADGWNERDPAGLAAYAIAAPDGDDRTYALGLALDNWSLQDPKALAEWLNTLPHGIEFDAGAAWMINKTDGANRTPEVAVEWVESISDPTLKLDSLNRVITEWAQTDRQAAQQYLNNAAWLDDAQRSKLLSVLSSTAGTDGNRMNIQ